MKDGANPARFCTQFFCFCAKQESLPLPLLRRARVRRASLLVATTSLFVAVASTMPIPTQNCAKCSMAGTKANGRHPLLFLPLRGGAVIVEDARGMCPETGPWLEEFDMPHEQVFT